MFSGELDKLAVTVLQRSRIFLKFDDLFENIDVALLLQNLVESRRCLQEL